MIEVNLSPGGRKPSRSKGLSFKMPSFGGGSLDSWVLTATLIVLGAVGAMGWFYLEVNSDEEELAVALEEAVQDSTRFADLIERTGHLEAQRDSIAQRVAVIQEIDEGRYVWPHILDEVARALPDHTWLTQVTQSSGAGAVQFRISGQAGNNFAVAVFMEALEASPYVRDVRLVNTEQSYVNAGSGQQVVYSFDMEAGFSQPPLDYLQTVPLFGGDVAGILFPDTITTG